MYEKRGASSASCEAQGGGSRTEDGRRSCTTPPADSMRGSESSVLLAPRSADAPIAAQEGRADSLARSSASQSSASLQLSDACDRTGSPSATKSFTRTPPVDRAEVCASYVVSGSGSFTDASSFDRAEVFSSWSIAPMKDYSPARASSSVDREDVSISTQDSNTTMGTVCCSHPSGRCGVEMSPRGSLCEGESCRESPATPDSLAESLGEASLWQGALSSQGSEGSSQSSSAGESTGDSQRSSLSSQSSNSSSAAFANALQATNLLHLLSRAHDGSWVRRWNKKMRKGLPQHNRDCMDMAGKLPLALKALDAGISPQELLVDCAQAGGLHGRGDGSLVASDGRAEGIEVKGAGLKRGKRCTFAFKGIRLRGTDWKHLFLLGREREPEGWSCADDVESCLWLGYVERSRYKRALRAASRSEREPQDATVTPGSSRSWLGGAVEWVRLEDLTREWWDGKVLCLPPCP